MKRGMTPAGRAGLSIAAALAIAGCSTGGTTPLVQSAAAPASAAMAAGTHARHGKARFEIRIPKHERRAHYVSPNTQSLTIAANGTALGAFNVSATAKGCKTVAGSTQCMFTVGVPTGKVTFSVSTFSKTNGTGSLLSQGSVTQKVTSGQLSVIPLTLEGAVASIALMLGDNAPPAGIAASIPVYVTAFDATGAVIIGPGNYTAPIALTNTDATGITALSTTSIAAPSTKVALAYNGRSIRSTTIGASKTGITPVSATFAPKPRLFALVRFAVVVQSQLARFGNHVGSGWKSVVHHRRNDERHRENDDRRCRYGLSAGNDAEPDIRCRVRGHYVRSPTVICGSPKTRTRRSAASHRPASSPNLQRPAVSVRSASLRARPVIAGCGSHPAAPPRSATLQRRER